MRGTFHFGEQWHLPPVRMFDIQHGHLFQKHVPVYHVTLYHTIPRFNDNEGELSILKTLWEKEKMLADSIFSFSHNVFHTKPNSIIYIVICKCFHFDKSSNLSCGKQLTLSQTSPGFYVSAVQVF